MPEVLVGHRHVFDALSRDLPRATLLLGSDGIGKWVLALALADRAGYPERDTYANKGPLRAEHVKTVLLFCRTAALGPPGKLVMICLDGAAENSQTALLKLLEEPPGGVKFILTASEPPLPTIVSRSFVSRCGLLSPSEVEEVLVRLGQEPSEARSSALLAGGRVSAALHVGGAAEDALSAVRAVLHAVSVRNPAPLAALMGYRNWETPQHALLRLWAYEACTLRWLVFSAQDAPALTRADARYVLVTMASLSEARPHLADRAIMEQLAARSPK
jgi:hypothetical protein